MKGISPMIATVLLVAFTVALGGIIMLWFTSVTTTTAGATEAQIQTITRCANSNFQILSVSKDRNEVTVTHFGSGLTVYPIIASVGGTIVTLTGNNAPSPPSIVAGQTSKFNLAIGNNLTVKVTALCQYGAINTSIEASCTSPEECWH